MVKEFLVKQEKMLDQSCIMGTKCCRNLEEKRNVTFELKKNTGNVIFKGRLSL